MCITVPIPIPVIKKLCCYHCSYYGQRHALGRYDNTSNTYQYITFHEMGQLVRQFASGIRHLLTKACGDDFKRNRRKGLVDGKMVSICGPACLEWYVADFAFLQLGMVNVSCNNNEINTCIYVTIIRQVTNVVLCKIIKYTLKEMILFNIYNMYQFQCCSIV